MKVGQLLGEAPTVHALSDAEYKAAVQAERRKLPARLVVEFAKTEDQKKIADLMALGSGYIEDGMSVPAGWDVGACLGCLCMCSRTANRVKESFPISQLLIPFCSIRALFLFVLWENRRLLNSPVLLNFPPFFLSRVCLFPSSLLVFFS